MRIQSIGPVLICCAALASVALAGEPLSVPPPGGEPRADTRKAPDLRSRTARTPLRPGRNVVYKDAQGTTLQAVVDSKGAITGYVAVDAAGKVSELKEQSKAPASLRPGEMALVHKCFAVTQECLNNPLPRSGNPEDCFIEIQCPGRASFASLLSR